MNQILYLALVQKHTSVQLDGTETLQLVLCICTFFIFFFLIHMFVIWKHMFQNTVQNTCIIKILEYFVEKKIKEIHVFPQALFFSTNFAIFAVVSSTKFVPGGGWNRSLHVPINPTWGYWQLIGLKKPTKNIRAKHDEIGDFLRLLAYNRFLKECSLASSNLVDWSWM